MNAPSDRPFADRHLVVGVGGGIAAFKAAHLVSQLRQRGARVRVILTRAGARFVTPLTFEALSHQPVLADLFADAPLDHVRLAHDADAFVVAPATYDLIGKLAAGLADDALTATLAATRRPVLLCPAMEPQMFSHPLLQRNLATLTALSHVHVLPPEAGALASGREGPGRLPEVDTILARLGALLADGSLAGARVLVTAGPTRERIDPMRVITNRSSGRMGFAMAEAARALGAAVTVVAGPTALSPPHGVEVVRVESAQELMEAAVARAPEADWVVMAAAVADWAPKSPSAHKAPKGERDAVTLELVRTPDVLKRLAAQRRKGQVLVGFAAETGEVVARARRKLETKGADFFVANDVSQAAEADHNAVTLLGPNGFEQAFEPEEKGALARRLWAALLDAKIRSNI